MIWVFLEKKIFISIILAVCFITTVMAQDTTNTMGKISIASPTAASLGKFGDIPVSYHTGIPQINIPIYTVESGSIKLPISLNYHASGLKVQEPAGWVGSGWALNAGGVITRTVMGSPDERGTASGGIQLKGHFSDYGFNSYINNSQGQQDWLGFARGEKDGEPDLFFFNFGAYSGKFYFRDDRTPILIPEADFKIVPSYSGSGSIKNFVITVPDGTQYLFGDSTTVTNGGAAPVEITNSVTAQNGLTTGNVISSWYLQNIISADSLFSVNLSYATENYSYFTLSMFPLDGNVTNPSTPYEYNLVKNIVKGVRLQRISFSNGTVNFIGNTVRTDLSDNNALLADFTNTSATVLDSIKIFNSQGYCKTFGFSYSYFIDNNSLPPGYLGYPQFSSYNLQSDRYRLRLDSLAELSCDQLTKVPAYKFSYFSEQVPRRISFGIDHWGFSNGVTNNQGLIPTYTLNNGNTVTTYSGANRDASWPAMRGGSLQKIEYPTGGSTLFDFEANDTYTSYNVNQLNVVKGVSLGMDGSFSTSASIVANTTQYQLNFTNTSINSATLTFYDNNNVIVGAPIVINPNSTLQSYFTFPINGTYKIGLILATGGNQNPTGTGIQVSIAQWGYTTIAGNQLVGGLRIKQITNNDSLNNQNVVTHYTYQTNGISTGILYSRPTYVSIIRNDLIAQLGFWTVNGFQQYITLNGCTSAIGAEYYKSPSSIRTMATTQGTHIGYSQVQVNQSGNGYSIYQYYGTPPWQGSLADVAIRSVNTAGCDPLQPNYPAAPVPFDFLRGELKHEAHYNQNGQLVKESSYIFNYTNSTTSIPAFTVVRQANFLLGTQYSLISARRTQSAVSETMYYQGANPITTTSITYYESPFHHQTTRALSVNSTLDTLVTKKKYSFDYRVAKSDGIVDGYNQYTNDCSACLTIYNNTRSNCTPNSNDPSGSICLATAYLNYIQCQTTARVNYFAYQRTNFTDPGNLFSYYHLQEKNIADSEMKPILELQDEFQNPVIESTNWKNSNLLQANYTHYDYVLNPINKVYPNKIRLLDLKAPSAQFISSDTLGNSIVTDPRYLLETTLSFNNGKLSTVQKRDGVSENYIWGYQNQYPIAKIINATAAQVCYTSFESGDTGNWMVPSTLRDNSTPAITGNQSYYLINGAITSNATMDITKNYIVSYWSNQGSYSISGTSTVKQGRTAIINGVHWTYYEHNITGISTVTVSGNGNIDELRLYPQGAQMTTSTYLPLVGMNSQCDVNNHIQYYEYDGLNRLKTIRDQDKNIIKTFEYQYKAIQ